MEKHGIEWNAGQSCGVLITNAFLRTDKFMEHYEWLREAAQRRNMHLDLWDNAALLPFYGGDEPFFMQSPNRFPEDYSFVIFWDKDVRLANYIQDIYGKRQVPIFNAPQAIAACDDKSETYRILQKCGEMSADEQGYSFSLIPTIVAPMTFRAVGYGAAEFVEGVIQKLSLPLVIKECFGSFGQQVYLAETAEEVLQYTQKLAGTPFLYQKYIAASHGVDVRLQVVGDRVVAAMKRRTRYQDFRANLTNGGTMEPYRPSAVEQEIAVEAARALGLSFAGVDLLFADGEDKPATMLCEVNSNAHFRNIADCTGVNTADCIMEYIQERMR